MLLITIAQGIIAIFSQVAHHCLYTAKWPFSHMLLISVRTWHSGHFLTCCSSLFAHGIMAILSHIVHHCSHMAYWPYSGTLLVIVRTRHNDPFLRLVIIVRRRHICPIPAYCSSVLAHGIMVLFSLVAHHCSHMTYLPYSGTLLVIVRTWHNYPFSHRLLIIVRRWDIISILAYYSSVFEHGTMVFFSRVTHHCSQIAYYLYS